MTQYEIKTRKVQQKGRVITKTYFREILPNGIKTGWTQLSKKGIADMVKTERVTII